MANTKNSPSPSKRLQKYFSDYSSYHKTKGNQLTHYFGITLIVISLLGMLGGLPLGGTEWAISEYVRLDVGTLLLAFGALFYAFLDWKIAGPFLFVLIGLYFLGRSFSFSFNLSVFILGWILQGVGHYVYEKKSPAFLKNITHLLIGPLWIFSKIIRYR